MFTNRFINLLVVALLVVGAALMVLGIPGMTGSSVTVADPVFHTPPMSNYHPVVPTPGWRTPQNSKYYPPFIPTPGFRTPPMSKHYPPFIPTPGWRTPPTSNYQP